MNEIIEEWKPIEGYDDYKVSNLGRIKSLKFGKEKILKQRKRKDGYLQVNLCKEGKMKNCIVHRLVANSFIPNQNNYPCVNHKDENKTNNCIDNLEWCDIKYNSNYGTAIQRRVEKVINCPKLSKQVYQYNKNYELVGIWQSTMECGKNGYDQGHVSACCRNKAKSHKGYIWSYQELKKQD